MSYKIAVASSDGKKIDETFGSAKGFTIYEVADGEYSRLEERSLDINNDTEYKNTAAGQNETAAQDTANEESQAGISLTVTGGCGTVEGCGSGAGGGCGSGTGCGGGISAKVELISDCRCIVCKKIGFNIQKQLEKKAISAFDVDCSVEEALSKISYYFSRIDNHQSLRVQK